MSGYQGMTEYKYGRRRSKRDQKRRTTYTTSVRAARRRKRRRMRRILLCAEVLAVACFLWVLFGALPSIIGSAQESQRMNGYAGERTFPETGERASRFMERLLRIGEETETDAGTDVTGVTAREAGGRSEVPVTGEKGVIVLDAGHGGKDVGCMRGTTYEKDINLAIAYLTADALRSRGYDVVMVREDDTFYELYERAECANRYEDRGDAVFVSIHVNAMEDDASVTGIECYANRYAHASSPLLADAVAQGVSAATGARLRKTEEDSDLYVVSHTLIPSCLIEVGFLSSDTEYALLTDPAYRTKIATGIADGIEVYYTAE